MQLLLGDALPHSASGAQQSSDLMFSLTSVLTETPTSLDVASWLRQQEH